MICKILRSFDTIFCDPYGTFVEPLSGRFEEISQCL